MEQQIQDRHLFLHSHSFKMNQIPPNLLRFLNHLHNLHLLRFHFQFQSLAMVCVKCEGRQLFTVSETVNFNESLFIENISMEGGSTIIFEVSANLSIGMQLVFALHELMFLKEVFNFQMVDLLFFMCHQTHHLWKWVDVQVLVVQSQSMLPSFQKMFPPSHWWHSTVLQGGLILLILPPMDHSVQVDFIIWRNLWFLIWTMMTVQPTIQFHFFGCCGFSLEWLFSPLLVWLLSALCSQGRDRTWSLQCKNLQPVPCKWQFMLLMWDLSKN